MGAGRKNRTWWVRREASLVQNGAASRSRSLMQKPITEAELGRITNTIAECYAPSIEYTANERIEALARAATRLLSEVNRMRRVEAIRLKGGADATHGATPIRQGTWSSAIQEELGDRSG